MKFDHCFPVDYYLNPLGGGLFGEYLEKFTISEQTLIHDFDKLGFFHERRIIQEQPKDYWRYIVTGHFKDTEDIQAFINSIKERFRKVNTTSKIFRKDDLFQNIDDIVTTYFYRDVIMTFLPKEKAKEVYDKSSLIISEFEKLKESETLKEIIGEEKYNDIIANYQPVKGRISYSDWKKKHPDLAKKYAELDKYAEENKSLEDNKNLEPEL